MNPQKIAWIKSQIGAVSNFGDFNTPNWVTNPEPRKDVIRSGAIFTFADNLLPNDRRILMNEGAYQALLTNFSQNSIPDVVNCLESLLTTTGLSANAITKLESLLANAPNDLEPDPNWKAQILATPAQLAGFDPVSIQEWEEAKK
jgi:hypothetical protein